MQVESFGNGCLRDGVLGAVGVVYTGPVGWIVAFI
jgi:hypothetical protein